MALESGMAAKIDAAATSFGVKELMMASPYDGGSGKTALEWAVWSRRVTVWGMHRRRFSAPDDI
ncbi:hypothetical protein EN783_32625 [Mesorhizobium sp. M2D.F.Ca.ET.140.01.1.1]|uniref:hypothetical protein n=1 Tax=Mesorhizobium sp. M2D.F.Ca.ET.140.01.1.1 TaxID=2496664 RepID=UPI000FCB2E1D|nr:hypothetical protein [Mesorhizobium sp. M2D.F.Ca.ET.140.01.1.1]RVD52432.1 hypothetical protein EN783_32625 [Mesorhizobium sp. M2D.F.Ca.ET.140.01.1.1]